MEKINKLCRVYGIDKTNKDGRRYIHYFYVDKKWDKPKYAKMIEDYRDMDPEAKQYAEEIVNEMFTAEEVELLKVYFEQEEPEMELFVQEEALTDGRVKLLGGASLKDYLKSLAAGRVRFVAVSDPAELGIK